MSLANYSYSPKNEREVARRTRSFCASLTKYHILFHYITAGDAPLYRKHIKQRHPANVVAFNKNWAVKEWKLWDLNHNPWMAEQSELFLTERPCDSKLFIAGIYWSQIKLHLANRTSMHLMERAHVYSFSNVQGWGGRRDNVKYELIKFIFCNFLLTRLDTYSFWLIHNASRLSKIYKYCTTY